MDETMPLDDVQVVPIFLGMVHLSCPDCEQPSDTIEVGIVVHGCDNCPTDLYGVLRYETCGCMFSCTHLAPHIARILEHNDAGKVDFNDVCELLFAEHEAADPS